MLLVQDSLNFNCAWLVVLYMLVLQTACFSRKDWHSLGTQALVAAGICCLPAQAAAGVSITRSSPVWWVADRWDESHNGVRATSESLSTSLFKSRSVASVLTLVRMQIRQGLYGKYCHLLDQHDRSIQALHGRLCFHLFYLCFWVLFLPSCLTLIAYICLIQTTCIKNTLL